MASALYSVPVASTPPLTTPRAGSGSRPKSGILSFSRSGVSEEPGSWKSSYVESYAHSFSLGRSQSACRSRTPEGSLRGSKPSVVQKQKSIPKSASFVRQEGFSANPDSPVSTPPTSPQPKSLNGLLSRQLSNDGMTSLSGFAFDYPMSTINRLEHSLRITPSVQPARQKTSDLNPVELLQQLQSQYDVFTENDVVRAFHIAHAAHDGRSRESGEPSFLHCVEVARSLAGLGVDETTVATALLHDVLDDLLLPEQQLQQMLANPEVFALVKQVAHLGNISSMYRAHPASTPELAAANAGNVVDMLVAMQHSRAVLVKLADRLHDMKTLSALPVHKRNRMAQETLDVWAPLANRVGLWNMKAPLEDLAFKQLHPAEYCELRAQLEAQQRPEALIQLVDQLRAALDKEGIRYTDLSGRPKHIYGVWQKLCKKGYTLDKICDVRGVRIIVEDKEQCYLAQRVVESLWQSLGRSKDYIRCKKPNGYQSLHTVVRADDGHELEVQIRTFKMHYMAEYGDSTAHWLYKEGSSSVPDSCKSGNSFAAKEANWAKFKVSQHVHDQKCRPSGSPPRDSLNTCMGSLDSMDASGSDSDTPHAKFDPRFLKFLERTGQLVQQPELRTMACVVCNGALDIHHLQPGTTIGELVQRYGSHAGPGGAQVVVNRQLETNPMVQLHTGDIVDIYYEKSASAPAANPVPAGDQQSKDAKLVVMGLGSTMPLHRTLSGAGTADKSRARNNMVSASGILGRLTKTAHAGRAMQQKQQQ